MECARAAGYEQVSLVGNSFGAQIVVEAALRHPHGVERIVLLGPADDPEARSLLRRAARWLRNAPDEHPTLVPVLARDLVYAGIVYAGRLLGVMLDDAIEDKLPQVRCPALGVRGGRDRVVPAAWVRRVAALLPPGELTVVPGYAHLAHFSGSLAVVPLLRPFLLGGSSPSRRHTGQAPQPSRLRVEASVGGLPTSGAGSCAKRALSPAGAARAAPLPSAGRRAWLLGS